MALYAATLIIRFKTNKSDAELLRSFNLHTRTTHLIGAENTGYHNTLSAGSRTLSLTSTEEFVILTGMPLVSDFVHANPYNVYFPDAEFFFFFCESTSMLNGYVWGKGQEIIRRKYVQNGKYTKAFDISPDIGTPLEEELIFFNYQLEGKENHLGFKDYMYGVHDLDIAWEFLHHHFFHQGEAFLEPLIFNRNINATLKEYIEEANRKVESKHIDTAFKDRFKILAKELKFKKVNTPGSGGKVAKDSYYKKYDGFTIYIIAERNMKILPYRYSLKFELDEKDEWITNYMRHYEYGVALLSFQPSLYVKLDGGGNGYIYTAKDLDIALRGFDSELVWLRVFLTYLDSHSLQNLFVNPEFYQFIFEKVKSNVTKLGKVSNTEEISFCLLHYRFTGDKNKAAELIHLLDQIVTEENKHQLHQKMTRHAINNL